MADDALSTARTNELTAEQVSAFDRDGFVVVTGLYAPSDMLEWKRVSQEQLQRDDQGISASGVRVWMSDAIHPLLRTAMADRHVVRMLTQLIGPHVEFLSAKVVLKNSSTSFASPWHQDYFYWEGSNKLSIWIALHHATLHNENAFVNRIDPKDLADWPQQTVELKRGDAVFFHDMAVHSSHPNTAGVDRWSLISTYRDASIVDASTVWPTAMVVAGKSANV